jgi:hypothetical protein
MPAGSSAAAAHSAASRFVRSAEVTEQACPLVAQQRIDGNRLSIAADGGLAVSEHPQR